MAATEAEYRFPVSSISVYPEYMPCRSFHRLLITLVKGIAVEQIPTGPGIEGGPLSPVSPMGPPREARAAMRL